MCCEAGTVNDLQELYPKTSERLKWMAMKRREQLYHLFELKTATKTLIPYKFKETNYCKDVNIKQLDRKFRK
jgi:hypothetical protein